MNGQIDKRAKSLYWGLFATLLASCGPLSDNGLADRAAALVGLGEDPAPPAISPEVANAAPGDLLLVTLTGRGAVAAMTKAAVNGPSITWISPGAVTMTFEDGILVGTRGFNDDLMGVDAIGVRAAIDAGGGTATRRHSFLDSEDRILTRDLTCTITRVGPGEVVTVNGPVQAVQFEEACTGPALVFTNKYWLKDGTIVRSNQAVSAGVGFIQADQL